MAEPAPPPDPWPPFVVLLGPDYAGKSSVLGELAASDPSCQVVSADREFLAPGHSLITRLRRELVGEVLPAPEGTYSADFLLTLVQTAVVHVRDRIRACSPTAPVLVDSYYYKILAKCRLLGVQESPLFDWWRSFPRPRRVIYLDVPPGTAWQRCGQGAAANPFEHYGKRPDRLSFETFQADLGKTMREEIRELPVTLIEERDGVARTAAEIREVMARELG